mmetsp:Transcript_36908/g.96670  ORF Transcript_36908/g.96670 Transcript_36908/m.96670 type:complete len:169 (-) Transcript_36908:148-654(-)
MPATRSRKHTMEFDSGSSPITTNRLDGVGTSNGNGSVDKLDGWDMSTAVLPREAAIERCVLLFEHACQCRAAGCSSRSCGTIQVLLAHSARCTVPAPHCSICRQLAVLCRLHVARCRLTAGCSVPRCRTKTVRPTGGDSTPTAPRSPKVVPSAPACKRSRKHKGCVEL